MKVNLISNGVVTDQVNSYFAMRKVSTKRDKNGIVRLELNNKPYFQFGPLDQGWWPDGLYTAPTDEAMKYDLQKTKDFGFNMIRKHVKVEPARWYTHCDQLGILV
jgi:beta-galactosidase/beta-glucuronidase